MKRSLASFFLMSLMAATLCVAKDNKAKPAAAKGADKSTIDAWVSDEKCGANVNAECAKKCVQNGSKLVVVNASDKSVLPVANQDALKSFVGQHVTVTGTVKDGTLTVASVKPAK